jgi:tRNA pseudouridine55 synthase
MDGLLVIDKPSGPTSHDVVARMRRTLRERRIGHTGTLDPLATGVLPLVIGRATRLARFLSGCEKGYDAIIRLGVATDTGDADGSPLGVPYAGRWPTQGVIDEALNAFRGEFLQQPPAVSAKKIAGQRSYALVRKHIGSTSGVIQKHLAAVSVTVRTLIVNAAEADRVTISVDCSAGFYVRALARDLGERLGTGGHLVALRRTRVGAVTLDEALPLADAERDPAAAAAHVVPMSRMLTDLPAMTLDGDTVRRTLQGRDCESLIANPDARPVRLLDEWGDLVAIAEPSATLAGFLHPSVVLR